MPQNRLLWLSTWICVSATLSVLTQAVLWRTNTNLNPVFANNLHRGSHSSSSSKSLRVQSNSALICSRLSHHRNIHEQECSIACPRLAEFQFRPVPFFDLDIFFRVPLGPHRLVYKTVSA